MLLPAAAPAPANAAEPNTPLAGAADAVFAASSDSWSAFDDVLEFRLDNGLTLLILPRRDLPIVSLQVWYRAGSRNEPPGASGIAHFLEHMYSMGTAKLAPREVDVLVRSVGGQKNASTSTDYTRYYEDIPSSALADFLAVEADRMRGCTFPEDKVLSERDTVAEERRMRSEDDQGGAAYEALSQLVYGNHAYGHPTVGWMEDIADYNRGELLDFYNAFYRPDNAALVIAGDADPDKIVPEIERLFGHIAGEIDAAGFIPEVFATEQTSERRRTIFHPSPRPLLYIGWPTVAFGESDAYALDLLGEVLAGGRSSRLYKRLVRGEELATSVSAGHGDRKYGGLFTVRVSFNDPEKLEAVEAAVYAEIAALAKNGAGGDELSRAKKRMMAGEVYAAQGNNGLAQQLGWAWAAGDWRWVIEYPKRMERVTSKEIKSAAAKYLSEKTRNVVVVLPAKPDAGGDTG
ncbi:MAG: insulinase family protein [bacterium]